MAHTRRQYLLVFTLPLAVAIGVMWLIDFSYAAAQSAEDTPVAATREADEAIELLDAKILLADFAAPAPLDPALLPSSFYAEVLASERFDHTPPEQPVPVPEPRGGLLLAFGLVGLAARRRGRGQRAGLRR